jgi:hypothetical protein
MFLKRNNGPYYYYYYYYYYYVSKFKYLRSISQLYFDSNPEFCLYALITLYEGVSK